MQRRGPFRKQAKIAECVILGSTEKPSLDEEGGGQSRKTLHINLRLPHAHICVPTYVNMNANHAQTDVKK